jgi:hypothetical protein
VARTARGRGPRRRRGSEDGADGGDGPDWEGADGGDGPDREGADGVDGRPDGEDRADGADRRTARTAEATADSGDRPDRAAGRRNRTRVHLHPDRVHLSRVERHFGTIVCRRESKVPEGRYKRPKRTGCDTGRTRVALCRSQPPPADPAHSDRAPTPVTAPHPKPRSQPPPADPGHSHRARTPGTAPHPKAPVTPTPQDPGRSRRRPPRAKPARRSAPASARLRCSSTSTGPGSTPLSTARAQLHKVYRHPAEE